MDLHFSRSFKNWQNIQNNSVQDTGYLNADPRETDSRGIWTMIDQIAAQGGKCWQGVRETMS